MPIFTKKLFAENYIVTSSVTSMSIAQASGSTIFGDSLDDMHRITGSLEVMGSGDGKISASNVVVDSITLNSNMTVDLV